MSNKRLEDIKDILDSKKAENIEVINLTKKEGYINFKNTKIILDVDDFIYIFNNIAF